MIGELLLVAAGIGGTLAVSFIVASIADRAAASAWRDEEARDG